METTTKKKRRLTQGVRLWANNKKRLYQKNMLEVVNIAKLERIPNWDWNMYYDTKPATIDQKLKVFANQEADSPLLRVESFKIMVKTTVILGKISHEEEQQINDILDAHQEDRKLDKDAEQNFDRISDKVQCCLA